MSYYVADVGVKLSFTITDQSGAAVNLSTAAVTLLVFGVGEFTCVVENAVGGIASYTISAAGQIPAGSHAAQIRVVDGLTRFHTAAFTLTVKDLYL